MSKNTANVTVKYRNEIIDVASPTLGVAFVVAKTPKGKIGDPSILVSNPGQLELYFGTNDTLYPHLSYIKDILNEGGKVRISRILGTGAVAASAIVLKAANPWFTLTAKNLGLYGNDITVETLAASDGIASHFNLKITDTGSGQTENYANIDPSEEVGEASPYTYLQAVVDNSTIVSVAYADISAETTIPSFAEIAFTGGLDGATITTTEYTGSQANNTGVYAFDNYEDAFLMTFPGEDEDSLSGIDAVGKTYCNNREDLMYIGGIPNSDATQTTIVTFLQTQGSSRYSAFVGGGLKIVDNGEVIDIPGKSVTVGHMLKAQGQKGVWNSPAGTQAGTLQTGIGVVNNFGPFSRFSELNAIANAGGNMIIQKNGLIYLKDGYTMSQDSVDKFISVVMTDIYIRKLVVPVFEDGLNKPNIPQTWSEIYYATKPYLDQMVSDGAINGYTYAGDQFANSPEDYEVNLPADVALGKYKCRISIFTVAPMVEVEITIIKTLEGVTTS